MILGRYFSAKAIYERRHLRNRSLLSRLNPLWTTGLFGIILIFLLAKGISNFPVGWERHSQMALCFGIALGIVGIFQKLPIAPKILLAALCLTALKIVVGFVATGSSMLSVAQLVITAILIFDQSRLPSPTEE